jgi:hypothetical protein
MRGTYSFIKFRLEVSFGLIEIFVASDTHEIEGSGNSASISLLFLALFLVKIWQ